MNKPILGIISIIVVYTLTLPSVVWAAKKRVKPSSTQVQTSKSTTTAPIYSIAKLSRPTNSVVVTFPSMNSISSIVYTLSYQSNNISQGVMGTVSPSGVPSESRDLYFGTCSKGVCTPHTSITNASLLIETTLPNGGVHRKRYIIKI